MEAEATGWLCKCRSPSASAVKREICLSSVSFYRCFVIYRFKALLSQQFGWVRYWRTFVDESNRRALASCNNRKSPESTMNISQSNVERSTQPTTAILLKKVKVSARFSRSDRLPDSTLTIFTSGFSKTMYSGCRKFETNSTKMADC